MFDYSLGLLTGVDLPIPEIQITIHQPTIKEISLIGEHDFFMGIQVLCINKNMYNLSEEALANTSNFQIFIAIMNEAQVSDKREAVLQVLALLFPKYNVIFTPRSMLLNSGDVSVIIDEGNFESLQKLLIQQFCLSGSGQEQFNPANEKAKAIAQKLMKSRQKIAEMKAKENSGSMFGQYLSVLTIGTSLTLKDAMELTMYQLYDLIERYSLYINWDIDIRSHMAGAKGDKPIENWMKQIH